ncbi:unnamed protein product [Echinostoma caproni]|uniref:Uncharacterized protein n=1 Tax=Echinostoma caproni TaxID=27848 RepID=A0A3P8IAH3_9TREM|nr:unnamed protein product [Echinostoma caproni]
MGCPDRIRFEYSFVVTDEKGNPSARTSNEPVDQSNVITCPVNDPDGQGISNGLRRLLHLNASDYLLHREWAFRQSVLNTPAIAPIQPKSAQSQNAAANQRASALSSTSSANSTGLRATDPGSTVARARPVAMISASTVTTTTPTTVTQSRPSATVAATVNTTSVTTTPTLLPTGSPSTANTSTPASFITPITVQSNAPNLPVHPFLAPITALPASVLRPASDGVQLVVADSFSVANSKTTTPSVISSTSTSANAPPSAGAAVNSQTCVISSSNHTTPVITAVQSTAPNLIMLPKTANSKGHLAVVERRLDIPQSALRPRARMPFTSRPSLASLPPLQRATPLPKVPISKYVSPTPRPVAVQPQSTRLGISNPSAGNSLEPKQSSLSAVKAFNSKRRRTTSVRGPRRGGGAVGGGATSAQIDPPPTSSRSFPTSVSTSFPTAISGSTQLPVGLPLLFPAPSNAVSSNSANTTKTSATASTRPGTLPSNATFIQGLPSLTPTVSVLNASSLLFGDGDTTLGTLLDPNAQEAAASTAVAEVDGRQVNPSEPSENIAYKCEETMEHRTDWNDIGRLDFHGVSRFCPSASTPHLPQPASPGFADISLTDSMAAAVMDTHEGDLEADDFEDGQVPSFPMALNPGRPGAGDFLGTNGSSDMPAIYSHPENTECSSPSPSQPFLRTVRTSSNEISTIDLNSLMRSMNRNSSQNSPPSID